MKRFFCVLFVSALSVNVLAQESETTRIRTTTTTVIVEEEHDLLAPLWRVVDATPVECGTLHVRVGFWWETGDGSVTLGEGGDDLVLTPALVWGVAENWELSARVPAWLGDGGDRGPYQDGNFDTYLGFLWRFKEQEGYWPAMALAGDARVPTGDGSEKVDGQLRLVLTNTYDSGVRSHVNFYGTSVNGDNDETIVNEDQDFFGFGDDELSVRDCQWGLVVGLDGPLGDGGNLRWVTDYEFRSSRYEGNNNVHLAELGLEWQIDDANALGVAAQIGIHNDEETPDYGGGITYSHALRF